MLKKIRALAYQYAIPAVLIIFVLFDLLMFGLARILSLLPPTLPMKYLISVILMLVPAAFVFLFGFSRAFKRDNLLKGWLTFLPFIVVPLIFLGSFLLINLGNPKADWKPWYLILYGIFAIVEVGVREECFYRATIQNILAKKHANSVKGIWITVIVSSIIFGLTHISNLFFDVNLNAVLIQASSAATIGLLFGAIYLRSGNIWLLIVVHTLTDIAGLAESTFFNNISDIDTMNQYAFSWQWLIVRLIYVGIAVFLLRPSKCKQICEGFCSADKEAETAASK